MTKQKKEIIEAEVIDESLAIVGEEVLGFLHEKADEVYEPGFLIFKIAHSTGSVSAAGHGSREEIEGIILAVEITRTLWFNGTTDEETKARAWAGTLPLCSSRANNGSAGEFPKAIDNDTPDFLRGLLEPVLGADYNCTGCPWNQFGTAGRGKLCKEGRRFLLWNPADGMAAVLAISPSSLSSWRQYRAGFENKHFSRVITRITFNVVSTGSNKYSIVNFTAVKNGEVTAEMVAPLGRVVSYGGKDMMEVEALRHEFLNLAVEREIDYPDNGSGVVNVAPESEDEF